MCGVTIIFSVEGRTSKEVRAQSMKESGGYAAVGGLGRVDSIRVIARFKEGGGVRV